MLSDEELRSRVEATHDGGIVGCNHAGGHCGVWVKVGGLFRAVEAAVRADQQVVTEAWAEAAKQWSHKAEALEAVISAVHEFVSSPAYRGDDGVVDGDEVLRILSQSPSDVLQAHDRQVAAKALTDAADEFESGTVEHDEIKYSSSARLGWTDQSVGDAVMSSGPIMDWLRARAVSLVPGNPEPTDHVSLLGGPYSGATANLTRQPARIEIGGVIYGRIDDPDTGQSLDAYSPEPTEGENRG